MATTIARIPSRSGVTAVTLTPNGTTTGEPAASYAPTAIDTDVLWEFEIPEALTGHWWWVSRDASGNVRGRGPIYLEDTARTYRADETPGGATAEQIATELASLSSDPLATGPKPADIAAITLYRGTTWVREFSQLGDRTGWDKAIFSLKKRASDDDSESILQIQVSADGDESDGILFLNGSSGDEDQAKGSLEITVASPAAATVRVLAEVAAAIRPGTYDADIKFFEAVGSLESEEIALAVMPFSVRVAEDVTHAAG